MHFHCTQCRHQFCSGCYNAFYAKNVSLEMGRKGTGEGATAVGWGRGAKAWRNSLGEEKGRPVGCKAPLCPLPLSACLRPSQCLHLPPSLYPSCRGSEKPGPQPSPTFPLPSGFLPEMSRP